MTSSATTFVPTGVCHDTADAAPARTNALAAASATAARFPSSPFVIEGFPSTGKSYRSPVLARRHAASSTAAARRADVRLDRQAETAPLCCRSHQQHADT